MIEVTAVADVVAETAQRRSTELGAAAYTDFRQMISEATSTPSTSACRTTCTLRPSWPPLKQASILCEKPLRLTVEQAAEVQRAVSAAGVTLMCAHNQLYPGSWWPNQAAAG